MGLGLELGLGLGLGFGLGFGLGLGLGLDLLRPRPPRHGPLVEVDVVRVEIVRDVARLTGPRTEGVELVLGLRHVRAEEGEPAKSADPVARVCVVRARARAGARAGAGARARASVAASPRPEP